LGGFIIPHTFMQRDQTIKQDVTLNSIIVRSWGLTYKTVNGNIVTYLQSFKEHEWWRVLYRWNTTGGIYRASGGLSIMELYRLWKSASKGLVQDSSGHSTVSPKSAERLWSATLSSDGVDKCLAQLEENYVLRSSGIMGSWILVNNLYPLHGNRTVKNLLGYKPLSICVGEYLVTFKYSSFRLYFTYQYALL